ncbi:MAG: hydroxyisourate hydrolase [Myxococcota bacterium]|nr:hydroxyisourate hydrolase [Myxococcota bacterium]
MTSPITTHVLDTALGRPAEGVTVTLQGLNQGTWHDLGSQVTNADGRCTRLLATGTLTEGVYRIGFATGEYFEGQGVPSFYPEVSITFRVEATTEHYHVPLLVSPFGYSTYRGS